MLLSRRMATIGPDFSVGGSGGHVISDCRCRPAIKHRNYPRLATNGHLRSGKRFARTTARFPSPLCRRLAPVAQTLGSKPFPNLRSTSRGPRHFIQWCDLNRPSLANPVKYGATRDDPNAIRSSALSLAFSGVAAVNSEGQLLIQTASTREELGAGGTANMSITGKYLGVEEPWSNEVYCRQASSGSSGGLGPLEQILCSLVCSTV